MNAIEKMQRDNWNWLNGMKKRSRTADIFIKNVHAVTDSHEAISHLLRLHGYDQTEYSEQLTAFWSK